jgi:hypothetical protein
MRCALPLLLALALLGGCAARGPWRTLEGAALGGGGAALAGEALAGPAGLAAGALAGSGVGAFVASKTARAGKPRYHSYVPVYVPR